MAWKWSMAIFNNSGYEDNKNMYIKVCIKQSSISHLDKKNNKIVCIWYIHMKIKGIFNGIFDIWISESNKL